MSLLRPFFRRAGRLGLSAVLMILPSAGASPARADIQNAAPKTPYAEAAEFLRAEGLRSEGAFAFLERLTRLAPERLTGSPGFAAAQELMRREMESLGLSTWREPVRVEHWVRGRTQEAQLLGGAETPRALRIAALGLSVPTPPEGITAPLVEVRSFEELRKAGDRVKGAIVFYNHPMDRTMQESFGAYGEAAQYRSRGPAEAAQRGAVAVLVRSMTQRLDGFPHTGMTTYDPAGPKIPAAAVATLDAEDLSRRLAAKPGLRLRLKLDCRDLGLTDSSNLAGEIRGSERPEEVVLLGAHLDAWELGTGAHDDGAGCVQCLEAVRLIRALGLVPKRTIRVVLYPNEEFGASAGRDYARAPRRSAERHVAAIESDRGGFLPIGFGLGSAASFEKLKKWEVLLRPAGIQWIGPGGGGADIGPLGESGTALLAFIPDAQRYFDHHHSGSDVLAAVHPRELELGAVVMAVMALVIAQEGI
jgi:carboxypeptidase Q